MHESHIQMNRLFSSKTALDRGVCMTNAGTMFSSGQVFKNLPK